MCDQPPSTWHPTNAPAAAPTGTPTQRPLSLDKQLTGEGISLKTSMPANWIWGDDPMERLECAGIKVELFKEYTPSLWRPWRPQKRQYLRHWLNKPLFNF